MSIVQRLHLPVKTRSIDLKKLTVDIVASTPSVDSYGTVIDQNGWDLEQFKRNPVITWAHDDRGFTASEGLPIANAIPDSVRVENGQLKMKLKFTPEDVHPFGYRVFRMISEGFLHGVSVGFDPQDEKTTVSDEGQQVPVYTRCKLLETAVVTIPSNDDALIQRARQLNREDELDKFRNMAREVEAMGRTTTKEVDPVRWNRSLGQEFDVVSEKLQPSCVEYDWVAKYIGCDVKQIFHNSFLVPSVRIGGFLLGLRSAVAGNQQEEVRNITWNGTECPPVYNVIQLNSRQSEDFLVEGISFFRGNDGKFAVKVGPDWRGIHIDVYTHIEAKQFNRDLAEKSWTYARESNPLKGEAFSLSGEFIKRTGETWEDAFLTDKNKKSLQRIVGTMNDKGKDFPNRGVIMTGPPGTGKTLSGRIIRNQTQGTSFIWLSSRDFWYSGGFGGIAHGFELARELAPSVLFLEDIDNWMTDHTVDLLKTEMDGIARSTGVLTILTTNFPERLPDALIDRPGRFHDVLHFNLPTAVTRSEMLSRWVEGLTDQDREAAVKATEGYSGAHMYELANFARSIQESDSLAVGKALAEALRKIEEQKELITQVQLSGSNYRPHRSLMEKVTRSSRAASSPSADSSAPVSEEKPAEGTLPGAEKQVSDAPADTAETDAPLPEALHDMAQKMTGEYVQKCIAYFEKKQPVNKVASKVLKRFFQIRGDDAPGEEMDAWGTMLEHLDGLQEHVSGLKQRLDDMGKMCDAYAEKLREDSNVEDTDDKGNVENSDYEQKEQKDAHNNVEDGDSHHNVEDSREEKARDGEATTQPSTTPTAEEAPPHARKAFVQLPLPSLLALNRGIQAAFREAAAEALRSGKSKDDLDGIFSALEQQLLGNVSHFHN